MGWGSALGGAGDYQPPGKWFKIQDGDDIMITPVGDGLVMRWQTPYGVEPRETSSREVKGWDVRFYGQVYNHDAFVVQIVQLTPATAKKFDGAIKKCFQRGCDPSKGSFMYSREKGANGFVNYSVKFIGQAPDDVLKGIETRRADDEFHDLLEAVENSVLVPESGGVPSSPSPAAAEEPDESVPF